MQLIKSKYCEVDQCGHDRYGRRRYCSTHYMRLYRYGTPEPRVRKIDPAKTPYRQRRIDGHVDREHRVVWREHHGDIPDGHHIHHVNGNKLDNRIENLVMLSKEEHHKLHAKVTYSLQESTRRKQAKPAVSGSPTRSQRD